MRSGGTTLAILSIGDRYAVLAGSDMSLAATEGLQLLKGTVPLAAPTEISLTLIGRAR